MNNEFSNKELGNILVTAISDGYLAVNFDLLANIDFTECERIQRNAHQKKLNAVHINTFLVQKQGMNILIDAGAGGVKGWGGELVNNLTKLGLKATDIDAILLTHAYQDRLGFINKNEVFPNIFAIPLPGHTPGHTGYKIVGSKQSLLIWGDIVHFPYIQLLKPNVSIAFDYDPKLATETRSQVLKMVCRDNMLVGGMHFGPKGFGYIKKNRTGYEIVIDD